MSFKSIPTMACALGAVVILLGYATGLSQTVAAELVDPETIGSAQPRVCPEGKGAASEIASDSDPVAARRGDRPLSAAGAGTELATFGMGCFWGAEADFCVLDGVVGTTVGYAGGLTANPTYRQVSSGMTGHAEVVQVEYDPSKISYASLLHVFWTQHDPTTPNRQGPDTGTQYRSLILYHSPEQRQAAVESRQRYGPAFRSSIVTELAPATVFYPAEGYHQDYLERHGRVRCRH